MKKSILLITAITMSMAAIAQTKDTTSHWKKGGVGTLNFGQSSFTNWASGGENSLSVGALLSLYSNYKNGKTSWDNTLDLAYGMLQTGVAPLRKNEDKIDFSSKYGRYAFYQHWYYSVLVNFKSQFADGYNYPNDSIVASHFMAPGYLLGSIGMDYKSTNNALSFYISPLTSKTTFVNDQHLADAGAYGVTAAKFDSVNHIYIMVKHGETVLNQFGGYLKFTFKKDIFKNVNFATKLELFSNYLKDPQNIVVNWENIIGMKVNKYLSATISTNMIYDNNVPVPVKRTENGVTINGTGPRLQFKEVLAIGLSYKF